MRPDQNTIWRVGVGGGVGITRKKMLVMILLCVSRVKIPHYSNLFSLVCSQDAISGLQSSPNPAEQKSLETKDHSFFFFFCRFSFKIIPGGPARSPINKHTWAVRLDRRDNKPLSSAEAITESASKEIKQQPSNCR